MGGADVARHIVQPAHFFKKNLGDLQFSSIWSLVLVQSSHPTLKESNEKKTS